jgi:hypothetical protein
VLAVASEDYRFAQVNRPPPCLSSPIVFKVSRPFPLGTLLVFSILHSRCGVGMIDVHALPMFKSRRKLLCMLLFLMFIAFVSQSMRW